MESVDYPSAPDGTVSDLEAQTHALLKLIRDADREWGLPDLLALDRATANVRTARDALLDRLRARGYSWADIRAATHVAPTTWRGRLDRYRRDNRP